MGHEAIVYGFIEGAKGKVGNDFRILQNLNAELFKSLEKDDDWPWVDCSIFSLPGPHPRGTYRSQIIHFGLSIKEDPPPDRIEGWSIFFKKFEEVLKKLYWVRARICIESDFESRKEYTYIPSKEALDKMRSTNPVPITQWSKTIREQT